METLLIPGEGIIEIEAGDTLLIPGGLVQIEAEEEVELTPIVMTWTL
jgi:hypothetical protein